MSAGCTTGDPGCAPSLNLHCFECPLSAPSNPLHAVAADLLAAAKLAAEHWYSDHPNDTVAAHTAREQLLAAIAKAEGKS